MRDEGQLDFLLGFKSKYSVPFCWVVDGCALEAYRRFEPDPNASKDRVWMPGKSDAWLTTVPKIPLRYIAILCVYSATSALRSAKIESKCKHQTHCKVRVILLLHAAYSAAHVQCFDWTSRTSWKLQRSLWTQLTQPWISSNRLAISCVIPQYWAHAKCLSLGCTAFANAVPKPSILFSLRSQDALRGLQHPVYSLSHAAVDHYLAKAWQGL